MHTKRAIVSAGLALALTVGLTTGVVALTPMAPELTILFTHDMHDRFLPDANDRGGFARLATLLERERQGAQCPVFTLDGGDFSMGSLFQTIYTTQAPALRTMGAMGYDATTLGNHEFDFRQSGFAEMLTSAVESGDPLPKLVSSNYKPPSDAQETWDAWNAYGITDYTVIEREGIKMAVFGLMGQSADDYAPMSDMDFEPMAQAAQRMVEEIETAENPDYIVCLSHAGLDDAESGEDYDLAKEVEGIDVIISGHTHLALERPVVVGDTIIVSAGEYGKNLGVLTLSDSNIVSYQLLPVDGSVPEHAEIVAMTQDFKTATETDYLADYHLGFDQVICDNEFDFANKNPQGKSNWADPLGDLIADSYIYAVQEAEGTDYIPVDLAVIASGVIRDTLPMGSVTTSDAFNVLSLGVGGDGTPGYPLVSAYLTGEELKDLFELDATVTSLMPVAQLWGSGMTWEYNTNRMFFNRVTGSVQNLPDDSEIPLEDGKLYRVVTGLYAVQMLGTVGEQSFGILDITPKDAKGNPITDFEEHIIHDAQGAEVKEWYALASYLEHLGTMDETQGNAPSSKVIETSYSPVALLRNANRFTVIAALLLLLPLVIVVIAVVLLRRRNRHKSFRRYGKRPK